MENFVGNAGNQAINQTELDEDPDAGMESSDFSTDGDGSGEEEQSMEALMEMYRLGRGTA